MTPSELFKKCGPSVANIVVKRAGQRVSSGSGFLVKGHLVTCAHVLEVPADCSITVRFEKPESGQSTEWNFANKAAITFKGHSAEQSYDYAIVKPPQGVTLGPDLVFTSVKPEPGHGVCTLGYPFEDPHLTIHRGIVSATLPSGPATMLKVDMSVNPSNSGGPLVCEETGNVVGVVARKATGLTNAFDELLKAFDNNIAILQAAGQGGSITMMGINPIAALLAGQQQMKVVSREIMRSANVGIGYAVWCEPLRSEAALQ